MVFGMVKETLLVAMVTVMWGLSRMISSRVRDATCGTMAMFMKDHLKTARGMVKMGDMCIPMATPMKVHIKMANPMVTEAPSPMQVVVQNMLVDMKMTKVLESTHTPKKMARLARQVQNRTMMEPQLLLNWTDTVSRLFNPTLRR